MNASTARSRSKRERLPSEIWTPGEVEQLDALVAACALVACADGWITPEERRDTLTRMRRLEAVSVFGVEDALEAFEALVERFDRDRDDGIAAAEAAVSRLNGRAGPSRLLVDAACAIAAADGGFDGEERDTILRICDLLDLDPGAFGLMTGSETR